MGTYDFSLYFAVITSLLATLYDTACVNISLKLKIIELFKIYFISKPSLVFPR